MMLYADYLLPYSNCTITLDSVGLPLSPHSASIALVRRNSIGVVSIGG